MMNNELKKQNDAQQKVNQDLQERLAKLESMLSGNQSITGDYSSVNHQRVMMNEKPETARLEQNMPNPFNDKTTINYTLPPQYSTAKIIVVDKTGRVLKEINVSGNEKGSVKLDASTLASGSYTYSLYVDEKLISTKQMLANNF